MKRKRFLPHDWGGACWPFPGPPRWPRVKTCKRCGAWGIVRQRGYLVALPEGVPRRCPGRPKRQPPKPRARRKPWKSWRGPDGERWVVLEGLPRDPLEDMLDRVVVDLELARLRELAE